MNGVRAYGMPAYTHIAHRICPICNRPIQNFEMHTRNKADHQLLRYKQEMILRRLVQQFFDEHKDYKIDGGIMTSLGQEAWNEAIELLGGSSKSVLRPTVKPKWNADTQKAINKGIIIAGKIGVLICAKCGKTTIIEGTPLEHPQHLFNLPVKGGTWIKVCRKCYNEPTEAVA